MTTLSLGEGPVSLLPLQGDKLMVWSQGCPLALLQLLSSVAVCPKMGTNKFFDGQEVVSLLVSVCRPALPCCEPVVHPSPLGAVRSHIANIPLQMASLAQPCTCLASNQRDPRAFIFILLIPGHIFAGAEFPSAFPKSGPGLVSQEGRAAGCCLC